MYVGAFSSICVKDRYATNQFLLSWSSSSNRCQRVHRNQSPSPRIFPNRKPVPFQLRSPLARKAFILPRGDSAPRTNTKTFIAQKSIKRRGSEPDFLLKSPRALRSPLLTVSRPLSSFLPSDATFITAACVPPESFSIPHFRTGVPGRRV